MGTFSLPITTSGEHIEFSSISLTTPSFTRPSTKMLEALAMVNGFYKDCAEASFRLSQIKITCTMPPGRLKSFTKQLVLILNMSARMHRSLNHMTRDRSDSITLYSLSSIGDELSEISATRDSFEGEAYKYLDALPQPSAGQPSPPRVTIPAEAGEDSLREDSAVLVDEPEDIATALQSPGVAVSTAAELQQVLNSIGMVSMALDNFVNTASRDYTSRLSNFEGNDGCVSQQHYRAGNISMAKGRELLKYKLLLLMMSLISNLGGMYTPLTVFIDS
jgi:hypothetical protein